MLLEAGAHVDARNHGLEQTPLHFAARAGSAAVATVLLDHGADINAADKVWSSNTPLRYAKDSNAERVVALLRRRGGR